MAEKISPPEVRKIARLGRILLTEEELENFAPQLDAILSYFEKLNELDTDKVEPLSHVLPLTNVMREDEPELSIGAELAVREAPESERGFFKVPKVLGDGGGA